MNKTTWLCFGVRCLFVAFFASGMSSMLDDLKTDTPDFSFLFFLFPLVVGAISIPLRFRKVMKKGDKKDWSRPSWFSSPFSGPPHAMHLASYAFMAAGLVGLVRTAILGNPVLIHLFPLSCGWGIFLGNTIFYQFLYEKLKAAPKVL